MVTRTESQAAAKLLKLADNMLTIINDTSINPYDMPEYKELEKSRKKLAKYANKYPEYIEIDCGEYLREFCIPFNYLPDEMFDFMVTVEWINADTYQPYNSYGFYCSKYHGFGEHSRDLITKWYIDFKRYIDLCLCYSGLKEKYSDNAA